MARCTRYHRRSWHGLTTSFFSNFLFTNLFSIQFLYFFIISSLIPYFNLFVSIFIQSYVNSNFRVSTQKYLKLRKGGGGSFVPRAPVHFVCKMLFGNSVPRAPVAKCTSNPLQHTNRTYCVICMYNWGHLCVNDNILNLTLIHDL
jgi:hypothetical protein